MLFEVNDIVISDMRSNGHFIHFWLKVSKKKVCENFAKVTMVKYGQVKTTVTKKTIKFGHIFKLNLAL